MLSPFTPLDRARLLVLVRLRLFAQMFQHGHEAVKTHAHPGVLRLEHMPLAFRLHAAPTPRFREVAVVRFVWVTLQRATQCPTLIFWDHIGKAVSLILND